MGHDVLGLRLSAPQHFSDGDSSVHTVVSPPSRSLAGFVLFGLMRQTFLSTLASARSTPSFGIFFPFKTVFKGDLKAIWVFHFSSRYPLCDACFPFLPPTRIFLDRATGWAMARLNQCLFGELTISSRNSRRNCLRRAFEISKHRFPIAPTNERFFAEATVEFSKWLHPYHGHRALNAFLFKKLNTWRRTWSLSFQGFMHRLCYLAGRVFP